ncbi:MAG: pantoate--beta-alanine ligase [SAR202 cluster bacterium]|nr:pantoate--beta-alanine ligase [SAR202 cluster bacterium]
MKVIETVDAFRDVRRRTPDPLGLVPTMGYLHDGHLALVRRARAENASVAASIFVNPTQFAPTEDLATYPRDMEGDLEKLEREGVDLVLAPNADEMYPSGFDTFVDVGDVANRLEGAHRPGHFRGVATVVCKLLTIVRPDRAYFGQKDAQQSMVIRRLSADLNLGAEIVVVPTVRDADGLALSSRNAYVKPDQRDAALTLSHSLNLARRMYDDGVRDAEKIRSQMRELIAAVPGANLDYVSIADADTLAELDDIDRPALVSLAVNVGSVRLIDNTLLP